MHPNWRALASVSFSRKIFVKAKEENEAKLNEEKAQKRQLEGHEIQAFYQSVLDEPSTSRKMPSKTIKKKVVKKPAEIQQEFRFTETDLFKAVEMDDIDFVEKVLSVKPHLKDLKDSFGWSLLMIACKAGSLEVVQCLVQCKADQKVKDKKGLNCLKLAKNDQIKDILKEINVEEAEEIQEDLVKDEKCELCRVDNLSRNQFKEHQSSTVHQFKIESEKCQHQRKVHYVIPEANQGFQMMLKSGWQSNKGLGPPGKSGKLYPVKTSLKRDRSGIGLEPASSSKKVTHFQPFDVKSVENTRKNTRTERQSTLSKKMMAKKQSRQQQKEVDFRREFM